VTTGRRIAWILLAGLFAAAGGPAAADPGVAVRVGIIIDDMGYNRALGRRALALPGPVSYSFLPNAPYAADLALRAHRLNKQVLLHLPMQGHDQRIAEPGSLNADQDRADFKHLVRKHLNAIPRIAGVNNHMGSRVTPLPRQMNWLMEEMAGSGLFFIDSRTTHRTVAPQSAAEHGVAFSQRDVFLDNSKDPEAIRAAFRRFINLAHRRGGAIAIAHPHPVTLDVLEELLAEPAAGNIELVRVSTLLDQGARRERTRLVDASKR
jgi:polysaccharide deacetylase 2 family uncharacterized protein YibQ